MANWFFNTIERVRLAIFPFASIAMLFPVTGKCVACSPANGNAAGCCSKKATATAVERVSACCSRHAASHDPLANCGPSCWQPDSDCRCCSQPPEQSIPPAERFPNVNDHAAFAAALFSPSDYQIDLQLLSLKLIADLASTIPHRILHCSWQI